MKPSDTRPADKPKVRFALSVEDLWAVETYFRQKCGSEFVYDEGLDVFCFPEDGRFAFCREFADWRRLQERGYLDF
jgi:hypothetical protein